MRMISLSLSAALIAAGLSACNNDYVLDGKDDEPPPLTLDQCAETGDRYILELAALGCDVTWGVDIGPDISGDATVVVGFGILTASGEYEGGGSCDLVIECQPTICGLEFITCMEDYSDIEFCFERSDLCDRREFCQADKDGCDADAEALYDSCEASAEPIEVCDQLRSDARFECYCIYDHCISGEWDPMCLEDEQSALPPPVVLGPGQWRVTRRYLDAELARLPRLHAETPIWPVYNPVAGGWRGARLAHVRKDSALHALGLRSGDILRTINQIPVVQLLVQPTRALPLRDATQLRLVVERGGTTRQLVYQIVP